MEQRKKSELTRDHILETGCTLVLRRGYTGVGLKELLEQSAVPKGSFYHYFPSKEAFGCALLDHYCETYRDRIEELFSSDGSGHERIMRYWQAWVGDHTFEGLADRCLVVKLAAEVSDLSEDMRRILDAGVGRLVARLATVIGEGIADGSIAACQPLPTARTLYSLWLGAAILSRLGKNDAPMREAMLTTRTMLGNPLPENS